MLEAYASVTTVSPLLNSLTEALKIRRLAGERSIPSVPRVWLHEAQMGCDRPTAKEA